MKTTFDKFITDDPEQKVLFDKEYNEFLLSEFILEKLQVPSFVEFLYNEEL